MSNNWSYPLKKAVSRVSEREIWGFDPDAPHPRIEGQFGSEVRVFKKQFKHLHICFDVSEAVNFTRDYADVIDWLDRFYRGIGRRFKRIHLNFWAENSFVVDPFTVRGRKLLSKVSEHYKEVGAEHRTRIARASAIIAPFSNEEQWLKFKPDMLLIFTRGQFENDLENGQLGYFRRLSKRTVWICFADEVEPDLTVIESIEPALKRRVVSVVKGITE